MSNIARILYNDIKLIDNYNIDELIKYNNNSLNSILIRYFIDDNDIIEYIINHNNLMRRDYLTLIKHYYDNLYDKSLELFNKHIIKDIKNTDLDFILDNKLYKFIPQLIGLYLETQHNNNLLLDNKLLKYYKLEDESINLLLDNINNKLSSNILKKLNNFWDKNHMNFDNIIDGGNVIYHNKGKYDLNNIDKVLNNSLVIIHKSHNYNKSLCYKTDYNYNDDIFILWFFLKSKCLYHIITNDKYKDHIYKYNITNDIYSHLCSKTVNYDLDNSHIKHNHSRCIKHNHSRCIQNIDNTYFIPSINNSFEVVECNI